MAQHSKLLIGIITLALIGGGWFFFKHDRKEDGQNPHGEKASNAGADKNSGGKGGRGSQIPVVATAAAIRKDVPVYADGLGTLQAYNTVTLHSQIDGKLVEILFREGQDVHTGDILARIDPRTYQAQLDQALATYAKDTALLENARRDLERYRKLGDVISAQTVDTATATVKQLEATLKADQASIDNAKTLLSYTVIASPINGRTGIRQVDVGNIVHTGDANGLVIITQLQPISVIFSLPQQKLPDINSAIAASKAKLTVLATQGGNANLLDKGVLELVDNQIDQATGTVRLKATFPNAKRLLWPGGFVNIRLMLGMEKNALTVPTVAIQRGPKGAYVFVLNKEERTVSMRLVTPGLAEGSDTIITNGLKEGEAVITDGSGKLQEGSKVLLPGEVITPKLPQGNTSKKDRDNS